MNSLDTRLFATLLPISISGYTIRSAPTRLRIAPWSLFFAFATTSGIPISLQSMVAMMPASRFSETATTTPSRFFPPSAWSASGSATSAFIA